MTRTREVEANLFTKLQALNDKIRDLKEIPPKEQINAALLFLETSCLPTEANYKPSDLANFIGLSRTYVLARIAPILSPQQFQTLISRIEQADPLHPFKEINLRELRRNPSRTIQEHIRFIKKVREYKGDDAEFYPSPEDIPQIPENSHGLQADIIRAWQKLLAPDAS